MPEVYPNRLVARIARARAAFNKSETTDGRPYKYADRKNDEAGLSVTSDMAAQYLNGAKWGLDQGHIDHGEFGIIQSALTGSLDPATGWNVNADFATKVIVTKVCNELLELRGDA